MCRVLDSVLGTVLLITGDRLARRARTPASRKGRSCIAPDSHMVMLRLEILNSLPYICICGIERKKERTGKTGRIFFSS